MLNNKPTK